MGACAQRCAVTNSSSSTSTGVLLALWLDVAIMQALSWYNIWCMQLVLTLTGVIVEYTSVLQLMGTQLSEQATTLSNKLIRILFCFKAFRYFCCPMSDVNFAACAAGFVDTHSSRQVGVHK
jgi:hypothetical protein